MQENTKQVRPLETFCILRCLIGWSNVRCQKVLERFGELGEDEKLTNRKIYIIRESLPCIRIFYRAISNRNLLWYIQSISCFLKKIKLLNMRRLAYSFMKTQLLGTVARLAQISCLLFTKTLSGT